MENLSFAPDNDMLNFVEVRFDSTLASITGMLCNKVFGRVPDVFEPLFFGVVCNLACSTKQQSTCSSRSLETLRDNLRELLFMES